MNLYSEVSTTIGLGVINISCNISSGVTHGIFGAQGKVLPDLIQHGRSAGMPLYVRCPICQKEFKQKSTLLQHGCIHIESRPYPCGECGKRFRQQSHLTQHLRYVVLFGYFLSIAVKSQTHKVSRQYISTGVF